ncbi:MAG: sodium:solute symporter family transporter [Candidatus Zhuqueibacterota bacterium]
MKSILFIDYVILVLYLLLTLGVGFYFMRFNKGESDFFIGGNKIPWLVAGLSSFMSGFSAWTFTGAAGIAYKEGITAILMYLGTAISFFIGYLVFAAPWRRTRVSSVMEYLNQRYNEPTRQIFSWSSILFQLFMAGSVLFGLGVFLSSISGFPLFWTIVIAGLIILAYCFLGGLWAVMITDFIQGIILVPFTIVMFFMALAKVGGISAFFSSLPAQLLTLGHSEKSMFTYILCFGLVNFFAYNTSVNAQRYFSVDSERSAKKVALFTSLMFFFGTFLWFIPPMAMRILYPNIAEIFPNLPNPEEGAYALASLTLLPNGLIGIMLAAIFSASMSSLSSFYNMHSAILSKDIFQTLFKINRDRSILLLGRLTTLAVGLLVPTIAIVMASSGESVFVTMLTFNTIISLAYGPPALLGLIERKAPHFSAIVSFSVSLILGILTSFVFQWNFVARVFLIIPMGILVYYACIMLKEKNSKYVQPRNIFYQKLDTPIDLAHEVGETESITQTVFRFLSRTTLLIGLVSLILIFFIPRADHGSLLIYIGVTISFGVAFYFMSQKNRGN